MKRVTEAATGVALLVKVFLEISQNSKNIVFTEHFRATASGVYLIEPDKWKVK